jgi:hypothetical protein
MLSSLTAARLPRVSLKTKRRPNSIRLCLPLIHCAVGLLAVVFLNGCFSTEPHGSGTPRLGRLSLTLQIGADGRNYAPASLGKAAVTLARAVVTMTAANGETLRDTITSTGSKLSREPAYLTTESVYRQELQLRYEITPSEFWKIDVKVYDAQDSVRYAGTLDVEDMDAYEYLDGCLPVDPRYAVVEARFRLPEFIEADGIPGSARALRTLYHTRLELLVEGTYVTEKSPAWNSTTSGGDQFILADSGKLMGAGGKLFFKPASSALDRPAVVSHDYGSISNRVFLVSNYGYVEGDTVGVTPERLLYQGEMTLDLGTAKVTEESVVDMTWKATDAIPVASGVGMDVRLGRAGKVVMRVVIPPGVVL